MYACDVTVHVLSKEKHGGKRMNIYNFSLYLRSDS